MDDSEGNEHDNQFGKNLFNCRQPHEHIHLKENKQVLQCNKFKNAFCKKKLKLIENLRIKPLSCFMHNINITVVLLSTNNQSFA